MAKHILKTIYGADNRHLTAEERQEILAYTNSMPQRIDVAREVEEKERLAVKHAIAETRKKYPRFHTFHENAWGKAFRDIQLVVRYQVQALLLDDPSYLSEKTLVWLRTILASFSFTPDFNRDTYTFLKEGMEQNLSPESYRHMEPYLEKTIDIMSDFPEPATPAV